MILIKTVFLKYGEHSIHENDVGIKHLFIDEQTEKKMNCLKPVTYESVTVKPNGPEDQLTRSG